jgi:hypothetical protein|tara:strand:+ start:2771 stop:3490 length:720 start_codon:yes stop_codon:yes gene_type:complete
MTTVLYIVAVVLLAGASYVLYRQIWWSPKGKTFFHTDKGNVIDGVDPAKSFGDKAAERPDKKTEEKDKEKGRVSVRRARKKCNCVGFSLGRGDWEIDTEELPLILKDNYTAVADGKAKVCNIIVYGNAEDGYDHIALVIEVTANGKPKVVRSKATTSDFVYDSPPDVQPYGNDYSVHNRTSTDNLPKDQKDKIEKLQKEYDEIKDKSSKEAHDAAALLCQEKNALLLGKPGKKPAKKAS